MVSSISAASGGGGTGRDQLFPLLRADLSQELQGLIFPGYVTWEESPAWDEGEEGGNWAGVSADCHSNSSSSTAQPDALMQVISAFSQMERVTPAPRML